MAVNNFVPGEILDATRLNQLVAQINTTEAAEAATNSLATTANNTANSANTKVNTVNTNLSGQKVETQVQLWSGNSYIDGSTNYNLWSSGLHQTWDVVRVYVAYDPRETSGAGGHSFEINCGPTYNFNERDTNNASTLCTTYTNIYRRLSITTNGINVYNGNGGGWYLVKVIGVKYKTL